MTETIARLREIATERFSGPIADTSVESPDFAGAEWLRSWEWYVDNSVRDIWGQLGVEARWVACIGAIEVWRRQNEVAF